MTGVFQPAFHRSVSGVITLAPRKTGMRMQKEVRQAMRSYSNAKIYSFLM